MAKQQSASAGQAATRPPVIESPKPEAPVLDSGRYIVTLAAATHLLAPSLEVEAANSAEAWQKFCDHNGISDSDCPKTITKVV